MGFLLALARLVVRAASVLAPRERREEMLAEWHAELVREAKRGNAASALRASLGSFADALALRRIEGGQSAGTGVLGDIRVAVRSLARTPGFTAVSVLTLAIGLGSMAAVYTLLDRIVLDPLPYPESDRLVRLENQVPGVGPDAVWALSTAQWVHFTDEASTLDAVALYRAEGANVVTPSGPERIRVLRVTSSLVDLLGASAVVGRTLQPSDDDPSSAAVAMISHGFWRRAMGADPGVVGSTLSIHGTPVEIVGVLDPDVRVPGSLLDQADVWYPLQIDRGGDFYNSHVFPAIGRLAEDATSEAAEAEAARLQGRLSERFPNAYAEAFFQRYGFRTMVTPLRDDIVGEVRATLWVLFGGVLLVLLVACANVTNLFLVRVEGRRRELALRRALGASRRTLARYVMTESLTLALAGGALAVVAGIWGIPALVRVAPEGLPRIDRVALGWETAGVTLVAAMTVGILVALYPLIARSPDEGDLAGGGRGSSTGPKRQRIRGALVVGQ
ncbi:MAG: ABC transporter permease, partial [Longimicrobiales bacterium]|nr:ABC transporter permease [Longimicrobiales bacterium]